MMSYTMGQSIDYTLKNMCIKKNSNKMMVTSINNISIIK